MDVIDRLSFTVIPNPSAKPANERATLLEDPAFGRVFTDHMVTVRWTEGLGWHSAEVRAREPFMLDPACAVLHYAQEIFEGMKAYRLEGDKLAMFRPRENARRFNASADRMAMPTMPEELFLESIEQLVRVDSDWVPGGDGSLYLRPFMFASEAFLGVKPASEFIYCVIACPVGAYFKGGKTSVSIWVSEDYTRAAPGGTGAAKCGGNYASSLVAQKEAIAQGCDQVVFLDTTEKRWIDELGGMNLFFVMADGTLVTPPLTGTILPGITRDSVIQLARAEGRKVEERPYAIDQWRDDAKSGRLLETFACGTAAVITPVGEVKANSGSFVIGNGQGGSVTQGIKDRLVGIQRGTIADPADWLHRL